MAKTVYAVLVVDRNGHKGRCSHCNKPATADTKQHACDATIDRIAIRTTEGTTKADIYLMTALAIQNRKTFVGKGDIAPTGWQFVEDRRSRGRT